MSKKKSAILQAISAAVLFGISSPVSKILLEKIPPIQLAALLYLGAALGMMVIHLINKSKNVDGKEARITKQESGYVLGMILLDIAAPILLMMGLMLSSAANVALLGNFEIVATAIIALALFKENIGRRLWIAIGLITLSSILLSVQDLAGFSFSTGSLLVLLACVCWGFENNCTRMLSLKDPIQIVIIKGFGSGLASLGIAASMKELSGDVPYIAAALILGFFAYGLSILFYVKAQRELGAARTSAYYSVAPFIGVGLAVFLFEQAFTLVFICALGTMVIGAYFAASDRHKHLHLHNLIRHEHRHSHDEGHHDHRHEAGIVKEHSHAHTHEAVAHTHAHTPDMHHRHDHFTLK